MQRRRKILFTLTAMVATVIFAAAFLIHTCSASGMAPSRTECECLGVETTGIKIGERREDEGMSTLCLGIVQSYTEIPRL